MQIVSAREVRGRKAALALVLVLACLLAACGWVKEKTGGPVEAIDKTRGQPPAATAPVPPAAKVAPPAPRAPSARVAPQMPFSAGTLSVRSECKSRDETGYAESIRLVVDQGQVSQMEAKIEIPRRGTCDFRLSDFRQTRAKPHVELRSNTGSLCTVRMWQQRDRFTVAFNDCHEKCTRGAFDYIWPVELNSADGSCL